MTPIFQRDTSSLGTVIGIVVVAVAILGRLLFDWSWSNPDSFVPALIGAIAAAVAAWYLVQQARS
ncbi:hypothetical protein [Halobacterium jilantaiense]|uniref:Multidrug transporter n=1 Tax=Halobacterium jilantaiense TaxID=355548 RepID=A0A1I0QG74_9EURY|nr:hypothetical protein [Halobacterium jilantaiense]SEW26056.1 hypothetical protein SAMN04487945_2581 [Halobacterium jilantaiense]